MINDMRLPNRCVIGLPEQGGAVGCLKRRLASEYAVGGFERDRALPHHPDLWRHRIAEAVLGVDRIEVEQGEVTVERRPVLDGVLAVKSGGDGVGTEKVEQITGQPIVSASRIGMFVGPKNEGKTRALAFSYKSFISRSETIPR